MCWIENMLEQLIQQQLSILISESFSKPWNFEKLMVFECFQWKTIVKHEVLLCFESPEPHLISTPEASKSDDSISEFLIV